MKTSIRYFSLAIAVGAVAGLLLAAGEIAANRYIPLGFYRNAAAILGEKINRASLAAVLICAAVILIGAALRYQPRAKVRYPTACAVSVVSALVAWGLAGYEKNRYGYLNAWRAPVDFHGITLPKALFLGKVWLNNLGITIVCAALGWLLYLALRSILNRGVSSSVAAALRKGTLLSGALGVILLLLANVADGFLFRRTSQEPNILLISLDTLRADFLGCYGYPKSVSPAIDRFAAESVLFENAYSQSAWTLPSHASLLTSRYPSVNRSIETGEDGGWKVPRWRVVAMEIFREAGYCTAGIVDGRFLTDRFGLGQGYDDFTGWGGGAGKIIPRAISWLDRQGGKPFFLFLHMYDIHSPYATQAPYTELFVDGEYTGDFRPGRFLQEQMKRKYRAEGGPDIDDGDARYLKSLYAGGILYTDEIIARLFASLRGNGLDRNTIVVLLSDHGEEFMEHDLLEHGALFRTVTNVPLLIRLPGGELGGTRIPNTIGLIDLLPTLLDLCGVETTVRMSGRSLQPLMRGQSDRFRRFVFSETGNGEKRTISLIDDDHHLIGSVARDWWKMFSHDGDPLEESDIAMDQAALTDSLRRYLLAFDDTLQVEIAEEGDRALEGIKLDSRTREALRAFGYIE